VVKVRTFAPVSGSTVVVAPARTLPPPVTLTLVKPAALS